MQTLWGKGKCFDKNHISQKNFVFVLLVLPTVLPLCCGWNLMILVSHVANYHPLMPCSALSNVKTWEVKHDWCGWSKYNLRIGKKEGEEFLPFSPTKLPTSIQNCFYTVLYFCNLDTLKAKMKRISKLLFWQIRIKISNNENIVVI